MITKRDIAKLEGLLYLHAVSHAKSKRDVAIQLGTSIDTINKYIHELEKEMKTCFQTSNGRGTVITPEGRRILDYSEDIVKVLKGINDYAATAESYRGIVRLGMTDAISEFLGVDSMYNFFKEYPEIHVESYIGSDVPDMSAHEVDIGIGYDLPSNSDLVLISVKKVKCSLFASQTYIDKYHRPKSREDMIKNHYLCDKTNHFMHAAGWREIIEASEHVVYRTDSIYSLRKALESGLGIGICPIVCGKGKLQQITEADFEFDVQLYLMAHKDTKDIPRIRVTLDYLKNLLDSKTR